MTALVLVALMAMIPSGASSDAEPSGQCGDAVSWSVSGSGELRLTGHGPMHDYGYSEKNPWYDYRDSIVSVSIDDGITYIGTCAFLGCHRVTGIDVPGSVTEIGLRAFCECSSLERISLPSSLAEIGVAVFEDCTSLRSVDLPDSLTSIGQEAFRGCDSLRDVSIGANLSWIPYRTFFSCPALERITVSDGNGSYTSVDGVLFDDGIRELICYPSGKTDAEYSVPSTVNEIWSFAFEFNTHLRVLTVPDSVATIGNDAFQMCTALERASIPSTVTVLDDSIFYGCQSLEGIEIHDTVERIGISAFCDCKSLTRVFIPDSVTVLDNYSFEGCTALEYIRVPSGIDDPGVYILSELSLYEYPGAEEVDQFECLIQGREWRGVGDGVLYSCPMSEFLVDGELYAKVFTKEGDLIVPPEDPVVEGRVFEGWDGYTEGMAADGDHVFEALFDSGNGSGSNLLWVGILAVIAVCAAVAVLVLRRGR